jgi:hypothetical protein
VKALEHNWRTISALNLRIFDRSAHLYNSEPNPSPQWSFSDFSIGGEKPLHAPNRVTGVMAIFRQLSLRDTANSSAFIDLPLHRA